MENKGIDWKWEDLRFFSKNTSWFLRRAKETFSQYVPKHSKVLEIGCGTGNILTYLAKEKHCDSYGIDISPNAKIAMSIFEKERNVRVKFKVADGFNLPFKDNYFDVVYSEGVIEHFSSEKTKKMVLEHIRVCKKKGIIIISVPNKYNLPLTIAKWVLGKKYPHYPERSYTINELKEILLGCNTKIISQDGFAWQQGFAFWRIIKKLIYLIKYFPDKSLSPFIRSYIGHECMVIVKKS